MSSVAKAKLNSLLAGLVLCSFLGSYAGKLALNRLPERNCIALKAIA